MSSKDIEELLDVPHSSLFKKYATELRDKKDQSLYELE